MKGAYEGLCEEDMGRSTVPGLGFRVLGTTSWQSPEKVYAS